MKFLVSLLVFAVWGSRLAAAEWDGDEEEVNQAFQNNALATLLCPGLLDIPCASNGIGQEIFDQMDLLMQKKYNKEVSECDDRRARRLRGEQSQRELNFCFNCPGNGLCSFYGCRRTLEEENHQARHLDGPVRGTKSGGLELDLFGEFPGQFALNQTHYDCIGTLTCTMEWLLTNCDD